MSIRKPQFSTLAAAACLAAMTSVHAEPIVCRSAVSTVKALTIAEPYFQVSTRFQFDVPNVQPLLETDIFVTGQGDSCVIADFSAVARPTDNYLVFQATLDDVPMHGHTAVFPFPQTPVVIESEETDLNVQRLVAHQFFAKVKPGPHKVRISVAGGSNIVAPYYPTIEAPVLTLHYR